MPLRLVVFDLSGTTIQDTGAVADAFTGTMSSYGLVITPEFLQSVRGASKREAIRKMLETHNDGRNHSVDGIFVQFRDRLSEYYRKHGVHLIDGALETFQQLRTNDVRIALNTGFDRAVTNLILGFLNIPADWISAVVCADEVTSGRPAPDMILRAMELSAIPDAGEVANVGDTVLDLLEFAGTSACSPALIQNSFCKRRLIPTLCGVLHPCLLFC
jgi:phosphonatase-like hydrolase